MRFKPLILRIRNQELRKVCDLPEVMDLTPELRTRSQVLFAPLPPGGAVHATYSASQWQGPHPEQRWEPASFKGREGAGSRLAFPPSVSLFGWSICSSATSQLETTLTRIRAPSRPVWRSASTSTSKETSALETIPLTLIPKLKLVMLFYKLGLPLSIPMICILNQ